MDRQAHFLSSGTLLRLWLSRRCFVGVQVCRRKSRRMLRRRQGGEVERLATGHETRLLLSRLVSDCSIGSAVLDAGPIFERWILEEADVRSRLLGRRQSSRRIDWRSAVILGGVITVIRCGARRKAHVKVGSTLSALDGTTIVGSTRCDEELFGRRFSKVDMARGVGGGKTAGRCK